MITSFNSILLVVCFFFDRSSQVSVNKLNLYEGEICRYGDGPDTNHQCKRMENCESIRDDIVKRKIYPDICSFNGSLPIVCCSPIIVQDRLKNQNIADKKCREYSELATIGLTNINVEAKNSTDENSTVNEIVELSISEALDVNPVVSSKPVAALMEFPHVALIGFGETLDEVQWNCGGSLISEKWILTAAHCRQSETNTNVARWARLGDLNGKAKHYRIVEYVIHPDYKPPSLYNDIALFRLEMDVEFSKFVRPICLNSDPLSSSEAQTVIGWHNISTGEPTSDDFFKMDLVVVPAERCNVNYFAEKDPKLEFGILPDDMICAITSQGDNDKDACGVNTGGPLQIKNGNNFGMYTQVGITSFGRFCDDKDAPGVYTRVSKYVPWIQSVVWS